MKFSSKENNSNKHFNQIFFQDKIHPKNFRGKKNFRRKILITKCLGTKIEITRTIHEKLNFSGKENNSGEKNS